MNNNVIDILLAQKFLPEHGGSIAWMHNVYSRWPQPVEVVTHDYYNVAPGTSSFPHAAVRPASGDHVTSPNLIMDRRDIFMRDWGIESFARIKRYWRMNRAVRERLKRKVMVEGSAKPQPAQVRVHAIHAVPEVAALVPLKWRYGKRMKVICYAHGEEITACCSSRQLKFLMHKAHKIVDLMIANSQNTVRYLANHIDPAKVVVLHPGVELSAFEGYAEAGRQWRVANGCEDRLIVLTVGRLDPRKNHAAVIKAVADLSVKHPNLLYVCAGGGQCREQLQRQAAELGVADRVRFPGEIDGPTKLALFGACDVFAMPAIQVGTDVEGFGMVFIEAGACGKPCVAGDSGGQPEAVIDGESGFVVDGKSAASVASALDRLLLDPSLRQRMGEAGRRRAQELDWPRVVQRTVELVEKL
ncbi:MAG: glycosyltransferase family 4 protein [Phycisphaeraceae bacterium]